MLASPLGVFDSGIGGLTVVRALRARLPHESLLYLGDTARVPYGTKSAEVVRRYALTCSRFLVDQGAKALVIACNTASAVAVEDIAHELKRPVISVIEPGAALAAQLSKSGRIGVIGTESTVRSGRYQASIASIAPRAQVFSAACPLFVPLAEEGLGRHPATRLMAEEYLRPLLDQDIDTLVLGCTHYPLLHDAIAAIAGPNVAIINSASAVADAVAAILVSHGLASTQRSGGDRFFATDANERFARVGRNFLGSDIALVEWVDL